MLKISFTLVLISIFSLFISSCDPIESPEVFKKWEMAQGFHEGLTHAQEINGMLFAASKTRIYGQASLQGPNTYNQLNQIMPREFYYRLPISDMLMATINRDKLFLMPAGNQENLLVLPMRELDPKFGSFHSIHFMTGDQISIDNKGIVLVPYSSSKDGQQKSTPDFLWIQTGIHDGKVEILEQKLIKEEYFDGYSSIYFMKVFDNFTRITIGNKTFDIDQNGNMELRFDYFTKSVQVGNEIITFASEHLRLDAFPLTVYKSDLSGQNSELIGTYNSDQISKSDLQKLGSLFDNIHSINGIIVLNFGDSIYRLNMTEQAIVLKELDNVGLQETSITSISLIDNSTVFITSADDKNWGGFTKSLDRFFTEK